MTINTSTAPFFDDFDETKSYHRILFKPSAAVQARELTQLQTQIQNQIKKFGDHVFKHGTVILGGERFFESDLLSIKIESSFSGVDIDLSLYIGKTIVGATSGTRAIVKQTSAFVSAQNPKTLIVKIIAGSGFSLGENVTWVDGLQTSTAKIQTSDAFASAMVFSINRGVFYVNGFFVLNVAQSIIVDAYSNTSSKSIGFNINESIIDADADESLLDNAQGFPNFAAPGADRYNIDLKLVSIPLSNDNAIFIEIARVVNGKLVVNQSRTLYSELEKEFARRTYDESGDYTVRAFPLSFIPHLGSAKARPVITAGAITSYNILDGGFEYTSTPTITIVGDGTGATATAVVDNNTNSPTYLKVISITPTSGGIGYTESNTVINISGDSNKITASLDPGKAYVKGFEFDNISQSYLTIDKARTTESADNLDVTLSYGNFLFVDNVFGVFDTSAFAQVELHNVVRTSVTNATQIGSAKVRFMKYNSGTVGTSAAAYRLSLFDIQLNTSTLFTNLESIVIRSSPSTTPGTNVTSGVNVNLQSKVGAVVGGDVILSGANVSSLVFPLNHEYVKELKDTLGNSQNDYTFSKVYQNVLFASGQATISTANGLERFSGGSGALSDLTKDQYYHVVVTAVGTSGFTVGQVLRFESPKSITAGVVVPNSPHQLTFNVNASVGFTASIIATINANTQSEKVKTLQPYSVKTIATPNQVIGAKDSIGVSDVYIVKHIYNTGNQNPNGQIVVDLNGDVTSFGTLTNVREVSANYASDNGQRDEYYDHASIQLKSNPPASVDFIAVIYNYFTHTGVGFLGVGSYAIPFEQIPSYISPTTGRAYNLGDCVDFRPRRSDAGVLSTSQLPDPDFTFQTDYQYYIGRIDKIVATSSKTFELIKGIPSTLPKIPADDSNSMSLYLVEIPPYTANLADLSIKYVENKRYTMRDIGKLERRIENIEYYTQLTLLEKQAQDESILDNTNLEKFKNGFFVDPFTSNGSLFNSESGSNWSKQTWGWWNFRNNAIQTWNKDAARIFSTSVSDSSNIDYKASIDPFLGELRAEFKVDFQQFNVKSLSNTKRIGDLVSLSHTEVPYITQPLASQSININPYNVITFVGNINLDPPNDIWVDTNILPSVNRVVDTQIPDATPIVQNIGGRTVTMTDFGFSGFGINRPATTTTRQLNTLVSATSVTNTNVVGGNTSSLGSSVVDIQYIPFIRSRRVIGLCSLFKPSSRLYPFIEKDSVSANCRTLTSVVVRNHSGALFNTKVGEYEVIQFKTGGINGTVVATALAVSYSSPLITIPTDRILSITKLVGTIPTGANTFVVGTNTNSASIITINSYDFGTSLVPDAFGNLAFEFQIPANKFKTGERTIRLIDNIDNIESGSESVGQTTYFALGTIQNKQETLLTTRVTQNRVTTTNTFIRPRDPLAQSFFVSGLDNPNGLHISSIDVYFKSKASIVPVSLEIRKMINGFPESGTTSIPFSTVILKPEQITTSTNGSVATKFNLPSLVHLLPGEYSIVLLSNSDSYEVFIAEMGRTALITNQIISKQPSLGILFKSQNASTWSPVQEQDLKFNINIAEFNTSGSVIFGINNNASIIKSATRTTSSPILTNISIDNLSVGDYVYGTGIPSTTRILSIQATTVTLDKNATVTGTSDLIIIPITLYQTLHINTSNIVPTGTTLNLSAKLLDNSSNLMDTNFTPISQNIDSDVFSLKIIKPKLENSNTESILLQATLSTADTKVSPVLDVSGLSSIFAKNIINTTDISVTDGEEVAKGGNALARYISKKVTLASGFDSSNLVVTLRAYKPQGTDVRVYYKTLPVEKTTPFDNESWVRMTPQSNISSGSINDYKEIKYYPKNAFGAFGLPIDNPISPRFNSYAIKIVLVSNNEAITPKVRTLRCIAYDS